MDNLWLARDSKGNLSLFNKKPIKKEYTFNGEKITYFTTDDSDFNELDLNKDWYPQITYKNSPILCSLVGYGEGTPDWIIKYLENNQGVFKFIPYDTDSFDCYRAAGLINDFSDCDYQNEINQYHEMCDRLIDYDSKPKLQYSEFNYKDCDEYEKGKIYVFVTNTGHQYLDTCIGCQPDLPAIFEHGTTPGIGCILLGEYIDEEFKQYE
jgi:hypothetical protein